MSSLIFQTEETQVLVATDTLATSIDGRPFKYTTKAFIVPHLNIIIAGTGAGGFLGRWFIQINDRMAVRGIDDLDYHTPRNLDSMWRGYKKEFSLPATATATVFHFGFSEGTGLIHSFVYQSAQNFRSKRIPYMMGVKPECTVPHNCRLPGDIRKLMDEQRTSEAARPQEQRVYIGGEIHVHHLLAQDGLKCYTVCTLDRFEDYDDDEKAIYENLRAAKNRDRRPAGSL